MMNNATATEQTVNVSQCMKSTHPIVPGQLVPATVNKQSHKGHLVDMTYSLPWLQQNEASRPTYSIHTSVG